ncbi:hypothetical protein EII22_02490 [Coriobacteriales bacterium OH1046]|nr:hypothetical protein EII22_02490 [Coriobacteriales bacterium OH1046]
MGDLSRIRSIVITGGPCSGKTTALHFLRTQLEGRGLRLLFVPEVATELILGGVAPWTCRSYDHFQRSVFEMQLVKERVFCHAAEEMDEGEVILIHDRGLMDNGGYMTEGCLAETLAAYGLTQEGVYERYDAVFHLVSAAKGLEGAYILGNNTARVETPEQAIAVDDRLIAAWERHPHYRIVGNTEDFQEKLDALLSEVLAFLED